jgi:hypothetical protein
MPGKKGVLAYNTDAEDEKKRGCVANAQGWPILLAAQVRINRSPEAAIRAFMLSAESKRPPTSVLLPNLACDSSLIARRVSKRINLIVQRFTYLSPESQPARRFDCFIAWKLWPHSFSAGLAILFVRRQCLAIDMKRYVFQLNRDNG